MSIVVPQNPAPGKLWVFHPSFLERDSAVALALLARGYYIVLPPISGSGAVQKEWDEVYQRMVDNGNAFHGPLLKNRSVAGHQDWRRAVGATLARERATGRPGAALEYFRKRQFKRIGI